MINEKMSTNADIPTSYDGEDPFIFVSYCHEDKKTVYPIIRKLREDGYRVWYDKGIQPSADFLGVIYERIIKCGLFLVFFSDQFVASEFCSDEVLYAKTLGKRILNVHLENTKKSYYEMALGRYQRINFYEYSIPKDFYLELYRTEGIEEFDDTIALSGDKAMEFFRRLERDEVDSRECEAITELDLRNNWIRRIPPSIGRLSNLQVLNLSSNTLRQLPTELGELTKLKKLDLSSNSFYEFPLELTRLCSLVSLNMGGNFLKSFPEEMTKLTKLESLDFYRNWFTDFPTPVCSLRYLKGIDASYNQFKTLPSEFFNLINLEKIDLNSTFLQILPAEIAQLENLITLDLSYNTLKKPLPYEAIIKWFERGIHFEVLDASYDIIMASPRINLLETEIYDFPKRVLLSNNIDAIRELYRILGISE